MQHTNLNILKSIKFGIAIVSVLSLCIISCLACSCSCSSDSEMSGWDFDISKLKIAKQASQVIIVAPDKEDSSSADLIFAQKNIINANKSESEEEKITTKEEAEIGKAIKSRDDGTDADSAKKQGDQESNKWQSNSEDVSSQSNLYDSSTHEYSWDTVIKCKARIGTSGIGNNAIGDNKSPQGVFGITEAFGTEQNPGALIKYTNVDDSYFWVKDVKSASYNKLVSTNKVKNDWSEAENIASAGEKYNYALVLDYNLTNNDNNKASGVFFECGGNDATSGSISLPKEQLKKLLVFIGSNCKVIIDTKDNICTY